MKPITEGEEGKEDQKRTYDETRKEILARKEENPHRNKRESKDECDRDKKPFLEQCCVTEQEGREQVRQDVYTKTFSHCSLQRAFEFHCKQWLWARWGTSSVTSHWWG